MLFSQLKTQQQPLLLHDERINYIYQFKLILLMAMFLMTVLKHANLHCIYSEYSVKSFHMLSVLSCVLVNVYVGMCEELTQGNHHEQFAWAHCPHHSNWHFMSVTATWMMITKSTALAFTPQGVNRTVHFVHVCSAYCARAIFKCADTYVRWWICNSDD